MLKYTAIHTPKHGRDKRPRQVKGTVPGMPHEKLVKTLKSMGLTDIKIDGVSIDEEELFVVEFDDEPDTV